MTKEGIEKRTNMTKFLKQVPHNLVVTMEMKKSGPVRKIKSVFLPALIVVLAFIANRTLSKGYPLYHIIPNFLLFTPFSGATNFFWRIMDPQAKLTAPREHKPLPEITKEEFSMEALEK
eukprot:CAMPEP_0178975758 /NCGR_PEP_ID=MMETSP0789-20121207/23389_1 /TAXON_ID=3005 /ORGANISM="Rhizosolenia setigera, Strain CCMP 1694" /LENGTH=118 /DNA_ID=CAMNT_0020664637 /DNA_START=45 /DNA_END=398 /DNA_ORIENTATION=-